MGIDSSVIGFCFVNLSTRHSLLSILSHETHERNPALLSKGMHARLCTATAFVITITMYCTQCQSLSETCDFNEVMAGVLFGRMVQLI